MELVESGTGLALLGQAGVGKSRLLQELEQRAESSGKTVVGTVATESTRSIPFAPFVELIPAGLPQDRLTALGMALSALRERNGGRGLLLTVDDAHNLDPASLALLSQVVASRAATVCLTARSGGTIPPDLVDMWTNGVIQRLDVRALTFDQLEELMASALGDVEDGLKDELWRLSQGNPLVLHELIEGAINTSLVRDETGSWHALAPLARSARLGDLVRSRLASLPSALVSTMEVFALGAPLPVDLAMRVSERRLAELEAEGLVIVKQQGDFPVVVPAHPMYGEVMVESIPATTRSAAFSKLVAAATQETGNLDPVRVALWQVESGDDLSVEIAVEGAIAALNRHEPTLAERLIRPLDTGDPRAALTLGRALSYQQRYEEAEESLDGLSGVPTTIAAEVASVRAQNLAFGLGRVLEGRVMLANAADRQTDPQLRSRLLNERALISAISGDFVDARAATESVLSDPDSGDVSRVAAYATLTVAQGMTGDSAGLEATIPVAVPLAEGVRDVLPFAKDQIGMMQLVAYLNAGRVREAWEVAREAIATPDRGDAMLSTWQSGAFMVLDAAGAQDSAAYYARQAIESSAHADPFGLEPQARGELALARGQLGDVDADATVADLPLHLPAPRLSVWVDRGKAWAHVANGDLDAAVEILVGGGRHAATGEHFAWACVCFHDVVRIGRPEEVLSDFDALPPMPGARLMDTMMEHARTLHAHDGTGVAGVASRLTDMQARLLAAEAWAQASALETDEVCASRHALMSCALEQMCGNPTTPAMAGRPALVTGREVEIAMAAAGGATSVEIAGAHFLSRRTVENHLQSVYRKCVVAGRDELHDLLAPVLASGIGFEDE